MKLKRLLLHFIIVCLACTNFFNNIYAENTASGSAVEYEEEIYQSDDEEQPQEETTTEATTADASGVIAPGGKAEGLNISAEGCALIDANTGMLIYGKNQNEKLYPASITKVMTGLLAVEYGHYEDIVTASFDAVNSIPWDSSKMNLAEGEQLSFENVIYGLMLKSGNDSAMVIAETVGGSVDAFVDKMNERAKEIGAVNTHFANPHGYHDENHYTTAYDMSLIAKEAVKNDEFNKIWGTEEREVPATNKNERRLMYNTDKMLHSEYTNYYYDKLVGGKTGYHNAAKNTLVSYASMGKIDLICVVMAEPSYDLSYIDTKALFEYGFTLYKDTKLFSAQDYSSTVPVVQYYKDKTIDLGSVAVAPAGDFTSVVPEFIDVSKVETQAELVKSVEAPITKGDTVGKLNIKYEGNILGTLDLTAQGNIEAIPQSELIKQEKMEAFRKNIIRVLSVIVGAAVTIVLFILLLKLWFAGRKPKRRKSGNRRSTVSARTTRGSTGNRQGRVSSSHNGGVTQRNIRTIASGINTARNSTTSNRKKTTTRKTSPVKTYSTGDKGRVNVKKTPVKKSKSKIKKIKIKF